MFDFLSGRKQCHIKLGILIDFHRTVAAVFFAASGLAASPRFSLSGKLFCSPARFQSILLRQYPDLQQMDGIGLRRIELAMPNS